MPALIAMLLHGLRLLAFNSRQFVTILLFTMFMNLVPKVLIGLGVGFVSYNLGNFGLDILYQQITGAFTGLTSDMLAMLKLARVDEFLSIVFGAFSARLTISGITAAGNGFNPKTMIFKA